MLFAALSNAVCLYDAFFHFFAIDFCKCFFFSCFVLVYWHIVCLFHVLFCIMHSAFNLLVFPIYMFTVFSKWKGYVLCVEIALRNNHHYCYYSCFCLTVLKKAHVGKASHLFDNREVASLLMMSRNRKNNIGEQEEPTRESDSERLRKLARLKDFRRNMKGENSKTILVRVIWVVYVDMYS